MYFTVFTALNEEKNLLKKTIVATFDHVTHTYTHIYTDSYTQPHLHNMENSGTIDRLIAYVL